VIGPVADFTLTNQDGNVTTLADLTNHVWVADIIFTRCAGPCPHHDRPDEIAAGRAAQNQRRQTRHAHDRPRFRHAAVMKKYGERFGADFNRWTFLTGTKAEIAALGSGSLKLSAVPVKPADQKNAVDLFIHTTIFVVVDKHARLRGFLKPAATAWIGRTPSSRASLAAVRQLEREP
jgi:cytochrome oxidase Cu insertion factor (SCO1/SenC/PrrC family)